MTKRIVLVDLDGDVLFWGESALAAERRGDSEDAPPPTLRSPQAQRAQSSERSSVA